MKQLILLPFFFLLMVSINAQQINRMDSNGKKQGKWVKKYSNGAIRYTGFFIDNNPIDTFRYFFPTGKLKAVSVYSHNGEVVYTKTFYINGKPMAKGKFINKKKDSIWTFYNQSNGKKVSQENYHMGKKNGKSIVYYPENEKPAMQITYLNGKKNGKWIRYYSSGTLQTVGFYINDTLNGKFVSYFLNGKVQLKGQYKKGLQNGNWITYDTTGKIVSKKYFLHGIPKEIKQK